jgi:hypothetical protein
MRRASASSSNGIRHATGPKISSCAIFISLRTFANTVALTKLPLATVAGTGGVSRPPVRIVAPSVGPSSI